MDFGATLCARHDPSCMLCPVQSDCRALAEGRVDALPQARPGKPLPERRTVMLVLLDEGRVLLRRRPPAGVWAGLWSLPETADHDEARTFVATHTGADFDANIALDIVDHGFSHYRLHIAPLLWRAAPPGARVEDNASHRWQPLDRLDDVGLPAPVRKLLENLA
jgi:A/G-specific adenine glycosylase